LGKQIQLNDKSFPNGWNILDYGSHISSFLLNQLIIQ
jgi:hypothetical protein